MNTTASNTKNKNRNRNANRKTRKQLLADCGLPDIPQTSHCFADATHHTCCKLGSQSREYADSSGNPIGQLSVNVASYMKNNKTHKTRNNHTKNKSKSKGKHKLTSWCTCTGSGVCSYYTKRFGSKDGTHIRFIGNLDIKNENKAIRKLNLLRHNTPGIEK